MSPLRVCNVTISGYLTFLPFLPIIGCRTVGGWTWRVAVCLRVYTLDHCIGDVYKAGARGVCLEYWGAQMLLPLP